jgi:hypothetical protein
MRFLSELSAISRPLSADDVLIGGKRTERNGAVGTIDLADS